MASIKSVLARLSTRGKLALGGAAVAVLILVFVLFQMATKQSYTTLATGIEPSETGQVTEVLGEKGIPFQLEDGGTAVGVPSGNVSEARIALAESNVLGGSKPGFELFDSQQFGASDFQQKVTYQRALEGELEKTIDKVEGVKSSNVQLTLPEEQLFSEESVKPTAAVLIASTSGGRLGAGPTRGIAHLVAASVEGLSANDVTITDGSGATLWPAGEGGGTGGGDTKQALEAKYDSNMESRLDALLARTIGPEKGRVQVQAEVDANQTTQSKLTYAKQGTPLAAQSENESLKGGGAGTAAGGAAGTAGNIPSYAAGTAGAGTPSNYKREKKEAEYGVDKTIEHTKVAPGTVTQQHVALILDKSVPAGEVAQLESAVESAAGIEPKRGDTITTSRIAFAKPPEVAGPAGPGIADYGKYAVLGLAAAGFLFFAGRHLRKRQDEVLAEPLWLKELNAPTSLAELEVHRPDEEAWEERPTMPNSADEVAQMDPDRVAQQLRTWMKEG